jgi:hypothetical protein
MPSPLDTVLAAVTLPALNQDPMQVGSPGSLPSGLEKRSDFSELHSILHLSAACSTCILHAEENFATLCSSQFRESGYLVNVGRVPFACASVRSGSDTVPHAIDARPIMHCICSEMFLSSR